MRLFLLSLLASCAIGGCKAPTLEDMKTECREIDWRTTREGKMVDCRILVCKAGEGNVRPVVLWCDEVKPECGQ